MQDKPRKGPASKKGKVQVPFDQFLLKCIRESVTVQLHPVMGRDGTVEFYLHADGADSNTLDFSVEGDKVTPLHRAAGG